MEITTGKLTMPRHIGIIPDGNRRWAQHNQIPLDTTYWLAMEKLAMCLNLLYKQEVFSICIYLLSKDNILRPSDDLKSVIEAEVKFFKELIPLLVDKYSLKIYHSGNINLLPSQYSLTLNTLCELGNGKEDPFPRLYCCVGYDPFEEIIQALTNINFSNNNLLDYLSVPVELDLIIRTGGDLRISGFLPLQSKYAEFFFEPYYFPDISEIYLLDIIDRFQLRDRRYGK